MLSFLSIFLLFTSSFLGLLPLSSSSAITVTVSHPLTPLPSDAFALLSFKSKADLDNHLHFSLNKSIDYCHWQGVKCVKGKVVRFVLEDLHLRGVFEPNTLTRLDQLRVLSLQNNSLVGSIPDLSALVNLKSLFLDHNSFSGHFPLSLLTLHRIRTVDLSYNYLFGAISAGIINLDRLYYLRLDWNRFNGTIPPLNQTSLQIFNVSGNNLTGPVPVTVTLSRFDASSYSWNPGLCGEIINKECHPRLPFFGLSPARPPSPAGLGQNQSEQLQGLPPPPSPKKHKRTNVIVGFLIGVSILIVSIVCFLVTIKKNNNQKSSRGLTMADSATAVEDAIVMRVEQENELEAKVKKMQGLQMGKSGNLVFCAGEVHDYSLEQLMRSSAELMGRGTIGTTYRAVLDNQLIVTVKRLDAAKTSITSREMFERHMESVGSLRHPNLVALRAYFQAKEERLLIYDYQANGSLFSLIHGSRSARAKPLHWTSCLKIAEDVAQGLAFIHQTSRLIHGNLKSSNILLGPDFEACLTDYCLAILADFSSDSDSGKAPETRKSGQGFTAKSDVFSFGVLLLELMTGKPPAQHCFLKQTELLDWVHSAREEERGEEEHRLAMLIEVAGACRQGSPEQRPTMWQVLKMIQEIKETAMLEENEMDP